MCLCVWFVVEIKKDLLLNLLLVGLVKLVYLFPKRYWWEPRSHEAGEEGDYT